MLARFRSGSSHHPLIQAEWQQGLKETFDLAVLGSYEVIRERAEYLGESNRIDRSELRWRPLDRRDVEVLVG
jgi:hypothetical protein